MRSIFKLRRLHALLAVLDHGSTAKAAEQVHMTATAVANAVTGLEADTDALLFTRTSRGMTATAEGAALGARARSAIAILRAAGPAGRGKAEASFDRLVSELQLEALVAVVEAGGFSEAARRLGVAQPSVYRAARDLAALWGAPLWTRRGVTVAPVSEARELARLARLCFRELEAALDDIAEINGRVAGTLNVGALPLARAQWLPDALAGTLALYPDARVSIMDGPYDEQLTALRHGRIDMIFGALRAPAPAPDVAQEWLFDDPQIIAVRADHPFAAGFNSDVDKLTNDQLASLAWVLPRVGTPGRVVFERFLAAKDIRPPARVVECSSVIAIRALLLQTDHAALLSRHQVAHEIATGQLKIMGPPLTGSARPIGITTRRNTRFTRLQSAFLDAAWQTCPGTEQYGKRGNAYRRA